MDDDRVWAFEESLWIGDAAHYRELVDGECVMVLPTKPFVFAGNSAIAAVADTPRWTAVSFSEKTIVRPQDGLITIAYRADAKRDGAADYAAFCTTTMRRLGPEEWRVVQHQQTPPPVVSVAD